MARLAGVDLPPAKRAEIGLTYIYGIGRTRSRSLLHRAGIDFDKKVRDLTEDEVNRVRQILEEEGAVEGDLRKEVSMNIKRHIEMGSYRGLRHRRGLPVRGQRSHTNARTRKGPRRGTIANREDVKAEYGEGTGENGEEEEFQEEGKTHRSHGGGAYSGHLQQHHRDHHRPRGRHARLVERGLARISRVPQRHPVCRSAGFLNCGQ